MRTIKFRAWNLVRKEMWTDFFVDTDGNICYEVLHDEDDFKTMFWPPKDKNILMQSTGLFDKNGVEIYEGDIIGCKGSPQVLVSWYFNRFVLSGPRGLNEIRKVDLGLMEVLGNSYEHPELLNDPT